MSTKLWNNFLENDCAVWNLIPKGEKTNELYLLAVQKKCVRLDNLPYLAQTPEVCLAAVKNASSEIKHVPEYRRTNEMFRLIIKRGDGLKYSDSIDWSPELYKLHLESTRKN